MRKEITSLSKHAFIYGTGIILSKAVSFIMLPVYTRYLTPADYGVMELLGMTIDIIAMLSGIGLTAAIFKYYAEYEDPKEKEEVISTVAIMMIILSFITSTLGFLLSHLLSQLVFGQVNYTLYFQLFFFIHFLQSGTLIVPLMFIRAMQNSKLFVLINLIRLIMQVSFNLYFLVVLKMGITGVLYSTLLADLLIGLYLSIHTFRRVGFRFSISKSKKMVKFCYPFIFVSLSSFVLTFSDRYFLNVFSSLETVGIYALAYKFGFLMSYLAEDSFMQIWDPQRFEIAKQDNALTIFKRVFLYLNIVVISLSLFICLFVKDVLTVMSDPAYLDAYKIAPIVILAYIIQAWTFYCNLGIYIKEQSNRMAIASLIAAISVTALNFMLIPKYGAYGAAWATVGAFFIRFILVHSFSQKFYYIDYGWSKQVLLLTFAVLIFLVSRVLEPSQLIMSLCVNTFLMLLFGVITYLVFLEKSEKSLIKKLVRNPMSFKRTVDEVRS